jgi:hypothetical protein
MFYNKKRTKSQGKKKEEVVIIKIRSCSEAKRSCPVLVYLPSMQ